MWTLFFWVVLGLLVTIFGWPMLMIRRAHKKGYDATRHANILAELINGVNDEIGGSMSAFRRYLLLCFWTVAWPVKLIILTTECVPLADEEYERQKVIDEIRGN